jgi:hypothetical protein
MMALQLFFIGHIYMNGRLTMNHCRHFLTMKLSLILHFYFFLSNGTFKRLLFLVLVLEKPPL